MPLLQTRSVAGQKPYRRRYRCRVGAAGRPRRRGSPQPGPAAASPAPSAPLTAYTGQYGNDFHGPLQVDVVDGALQLTLGPTPLRLAARHWDADVFAFTPQAYPPGSVSKASFTDRQLTLEPYDDGRGLGTFVR